MIGRTGIFLRSPLKRFKIFNNSIHYQSKGMEIDGNNTQNGAVGLDLINSNSIGVSVNNSNNKFYFDQNSIFNHFYAVHVNSKENVRIIGYNFPTKICVSKGFPTIIRQNKIASVTGSDMPILLSEGNNSIVAPSEAWFLQKWERHFRKL